MLRPRLAPPAGSRLRSLARAAAAGLLCARAVALRGVGLAPVLCACICLIFHNASAMCGASGPAVRAGRACASGRAARLGRGAQLQVDHAVGGKVFGRLARDALHARMRGRARVDRAEQLEALWQRARACTRSATACQISQPASGR